MKDPYPQYKFMFDTAGEHLVRFVALNNPDTYPFDEFHSHEYHEMLVFTQGGGRHNINFHEYRIDNYSVHLLAAGDVHLVERGLQSEGFALVYDDAFLIRLKELNPHVAYFECLAHSGVVALSETSEEEAFRMLISEIIRNRQDRPYNLSLIAAFLTKLVLCFPDRRKDNEVSRQYPLVVQLIGLINRHFAEHLSAAAYAEKAGCSLSSLEKKVKAATGMTIGQLQQERLINEAKRLLCQPDSTAKEVAYTLGFNEESYFCRWFKKITGLPPLKFKGSAIPVLWAIGCLIQDNVELFLP